MRPFRALEGGVANPGLAPRALIKRRFAAFEPFVHVVCLLAHLAVSRLSLQAPKVRLNKAQGASPG